MIGQTIQVEQTSAMGLSPLERSSVSSSPAPDPMGRYRRTRRIRSNMSSWQ